MPIISVEILNIVDGRERHDTRCVVMRWSSSEAAKAMKIIDERETQRKKKERKRNQRNESYSKRVRDWAFNLGIDDQLICKASLIFKSKLELALSIILREGLYRSICDMFEVWYINYWYLKLIHHKTR